MFTTENGNAEWKFLPGKVGRRYRDVGGEVIILSPFYFQQFYKARLVRVKTERYINIYCSFHYIMHQENNICYKY